MAASNDEYSHVSNNIIDLDNYMKGSIFQYGEAAPQKLPENNFVVDGGSYDRRYLQGRKTPPIQYNGTPQEYRVSPQESRVPPQDYRIPPQDYRVPPQDYRIPQEYRVPPQDYRIPSQEHRVPSQEYRAPPQECRTATHIPVKMDKGRYYRSSDETSVTDSTFQESGYLRNQKQCSLDSGVSEGFHHTRRNKKHHHSNIDVYERRRIREFQHKLRSNNTEHNLKEKNQELEILKSLEEKYEKNLKQQEEKIDRLAALCEECIKKEKSAPKELSSSDGSSSISNNFDASKIVIHADKCMKSIEKLNECKTYKIIMSKLDELNRHLHSKQQESVRMVSKASRSTESVSVSDKGVGTDLQHAKDKPITPRTKSKTLSSRDRKVKKDRNTSTSEDDDVHKPRRRKPRPKAIEESDPDTKKLDHYFSGSSGCEKKNLSVEEKIRMRQVYMALTKDGHFAKRRVRVGDFDPKMYGFNEYNLNDPISFYNRSKRLGIPVMQQEPQMSPPSICTFCRFYWVKLRTSGREFCRQMLCCGDGISMASELLKEEIVANFQELDKEKIN